MHRIENRTLDELQIGESASLARMLRLSSCANALLLARHKPGVKS